MVRTDRGFQLLGHVQAALQAVSVIKIFGLPIISLVRPFQIVTQAAHISKVEGYLLAVHLPIAQRHSFIPVSNIRGSVDVLNYIAVSGEHALSICCLYCV